MLYELNHINFPPVCLAPMELVLLVDTDQNISSDDFEAVKAFLLSLILRYESFSFSFEPRDEKTNILVFDQV